MARSARHSVEVPAIHHLGALYRGFGESASRSGPIRTRRPGSKTVGGCRVSILREGGLITGEGGDVPFSTIRTMSATWRSQRCRADTRFRFWDKAALPSRLNDQDSGVFIVIMQRVHERDLSGHIMAREQGWTHLCLPAEYEAKHPFPIRTSVIYKSTGKIWADPRKDGEPLWPERFSSDALHRMAKDETMSSHMAAGQLQQRPTARDGGMFKRAWFANPAKFVDLEQLQLVRAWDLAWTADADLTPTSVSAC